MHKFFITILIFIIPLIVFADNSGNSTGFVWSEKIGWIHFSGEDAGIDYGIKISSDQISGYVWSEKTGWISLNCLNDLSCNSQPYGVVSDGEGNMSGYAWSEKGGWINFNGTGAVEYQTQIDSDGNMTGYAWSEKVGWINSDDVGDYYGVTTEAGEAYCEDCVPCNPPVVAWNFDEGFGTTAYDSSFRGNNINNDGTLTNGPIWQNRDLCVSGKCLQFDGNDDYVNRTYDTDLSFKDNSFSIGGWLKTSTIVGPAYLFSRYDTAGWKVWLEADGDACFGIDDDNTWVDESSDDFICTAGKNYNDNNWHYILAKKDSLNGIYLYMDGQLIVSDESLTASGSLSGTNPVFYTGVNSDGISDHFFGFLDEFKLYDYARSEDQIKQDYNAGLSGVNSNRGTSVSIGDNSAKWMSDGLVGYWKMDESSWNGTTNEVRDVSGNNNHGTASGGSLPAGGRFGNGGNFDGVDDYVELKNINSNTGFSISTWAYVDDNTLYNQLGIVSTRTGVGNSIYMQYRDFGDNDRLYFGAGGYLMDNYFSIENNSCYQKWCNYTITYNNDGTVKAYIDGEYIDMSTTSANIVFSQDIFIGQGIFGNGEFFDGKIDETRIYNRALSPDEIQQLYNYAPGPVLHLKMDEKSGTTAFDSSGNNKNGTLSGGPIWENGKINGGINFDGVDDYVSVGADPSLDFGLGSFTVGHWVKISQTPTAELVTVHKLGNSYGSGWWFYVNTSGIANFWFRDGPNYNNKTTSILNLNQWYYLSAVVNRNDNTVRLYLNGIEQGSASSIFGWGDIDAEGDFFGIAMRRPDYPYFKGDIDDVKVYNYARTQEQILEDMSAQGASLSSNAGALKKPILDLNFNEGYGSTAYDSSGPPAGGNHGTLISGTTGANTTPTMMWDKNGKEGGAMEFDNSDDYINVGSNVNISNKSFTISSWAKRNSINSEDFIAGQGLNFQNNAALQFGFRLTGHFTCAFYNNDLDVAIVNDIDWHHWVCSYNADTNLRIIYKDGKEIARGTATADYQGSGVFNIGARYSPPADYFNGLIDEFKLYSYALDEDEIKTLYNDSSAMVMGSDESRNNNGTEVSGSNKDYCIPGDTAKCDKPVLELKMDEKTGTTAFDTSGNGRNGTLRNGTIWDTGKVGTSLNFDGIDDDVNNIPNVDIQGNFTISTWIKPETLSGERTIFYATSDFFVDQNGPTLSWRFVNPVCVVDGAGNQASFYSGQVLNKDEWQYVSFVSDATNNKIYIYRNGKTVLDQAGKSDCVPTNNTEYVGSTNSRRFDGGIDEFKIYNYARTPAQIAWDYNRGKPMAHWKMDETSGTQVDDWSGNAKHGTMTNMDPIGDRVEGKKNKALDFDGVDDVVSVSNFQFSSNDRFAISQFVNFKTLATGKPIVAQWGGSQNNILIKTDDTNSDELKICIASSLTDACTNYAITADLNLTTNQWIHIQAVYSGAGATNANKLKLYINGAEKTLAFTGTIPATIQTTSTAGLTMGGNSGAYINAILDEVKIYNYALTDEQIKLDYNGGAVSFE